MPRTRPPYPPEFRIEAVRMLRAGVRTPKQLAGELGGDPSKLQARESDEALASTDARGVIRQAHRPRARRRRAARPIDRRAKTSRAVLLTPVPAHRPRPGRWRRATRTPRTRACSRAGDLRPRRNRRRGRDRRMRGRNPRDIRPRRAPCSPRPRGSAAALAARAVAGSGSQHDGGRTTRSASAGKRNQRTDRRATLRRRHVKGKLRTRNARGNPPHSDACEVVPILRPSNLSGVPIQKPLSHDMA